MKQKTGVIFLFCILMLVTITVCYNNSAQEYSKWVMRPMVMIEDSIYMSTGKDVFVGKNTITALGTIASSADVSEIPTENGQSNFGYVGSEYSYYEKGVLVKYR